MSSKNTNSICNTFLHHTNHVHKAHPANIQSCKYGLFVDNNK